MASCHCRYGVPVAYGRAYMELRPMASPLDPGVWHMGVVVYAPIIA